MWILAVARRIGGWAERSGWRDPRVTDVLLILGIIRIPELAVAFLQRRPTAGRLFG